MARRQHSALVRAADATAATTTATTGSGTSSSGTIDLMGWDTVFALTLEALNDSIVAQKTTPAAFTGHDTQGGATVTGTWSDWSVIGGEGDGIILKCPVQTGSFTLAEGSPAVSLDGGYVEVEITLVTLTATAELQDATAQPNSGTTYNFKANGSSTDEFQQPSVQSVNFTGVTGYAVYGAIAAFNAYFKGDIAAFDAVFSAVRLEEAAVEADKQWLKPQQSLYAMAQAGTGAAQQSYFGLLSLTSPPAEGGTLPQQNFDLRMFDSFAATTPPTNSVFAISGPLSMANIVLASAQTCVKGSTAADFKLVNEGVTVVNVNTLEWGDFQWDKDDPNSTVTPSIAPGNFQLSLDGADFHLAISQAAFTTPDGTCDVKLSADQFFSFGATKLSDGNYYFTPDPGLGTNSVRADVTANKNFQIAMIIESVVLGVAFSMFGAELGEALGDAVSTTAQTAETATLEATEEAVNEGVDSLGPEAVTEATDNAVADATESIASDGENTGGRTGLFANKFKIWGGVLGGMFAIPVGVLPQIMTKIYSDQITTGDVPTVDQFATNFTGAVQWPAIEDWQVTGGTFSGAFLLGGHAS
jgi:Clostridium P-47 protein